MASYITTVLSKSPFCFPYLNELTGTTIADLSVNNDPGTYFDDAVKGLESSIETDITSRSVGGRVGLMPASAPLDDFGWFGWFEFDPDFVASGIVCRNGQIGLPGSNMLVVDHGLGLLAARINLDANPFVFFDLSFPLSVPGFYRGGVTRTGPVMRLWLNGRLVNERVDLPSDSFTNPSYISGGGGFGWKIGVTGDTGNVWGGVRTGPIELYDHTIGEADDLEIYESARNRLPMFVDFHMRTTMTADLTPPPVYAAFPYSHDFTTPAIERLIRLTEVIEADDGGEERNGQSDKTRRRYTYEIPILDAHSRRRLKAFLRNHRKQPVIWPIAPDEVELVDPISAGDNVVIPIDTQYMDCDIGGHAILSISETVFEAIEIVDFDAESITAKQVVHDWPTGTLLQFAKRAIVQQDISLTSITDDTQDMTLTATILVEDITEAPNRITPYTPTTYRGVEVFNPFEFGLNDTSEPSDDDSHLVAEITDTGQGIFRLNTDQDFAKEGIGYTFYLDGRELISRWLGWFERRAGRLNNLWVPTMVHDIGELLDIDGGDITLDDSHYEADYLNDPTRSDLVLVGFDETVGFRHINSVAQNEDSNEVLTLSAAASPYTILNTEFVCFALMCRLDADECELAWFTNDMLKATVKFREVPKEAI